MNFREKLLLATKGDCIVKNGKPLINPTMAEIKEACRRLSANVQGSICAAHLINKPITKTEFFAVGETVVPVCILLF